MSPLLGPKDGVPFAGTRMRKRNSGVCPAVMKQPAFGSHEPCIGVTVPPLGERGPPTGTGRQQPARRAGHDKETGAERERRRSPQKLPPSTGAGRWFWGLGLPRGIVGWKVGVWVMPEGAPQKTSAGRSGGSTEILQQRGCGALTRAAPKAAITGRAPSSPRAP